MSERLKLVSFQCFIYSCVQLPYPNCFPNTHSLTPTFPGCWPILTFDFCPVGGDISSKVFLASSRNRYSALRAALQRSFLSLMWSYICVPVVLSSFLTNSYRRGETRTLKWCHWDLHCGYWISISPLNWKDHSSDLSSVSISLGKPFLTWLAWVLHNVLSKRHVTFLLNKCHHCSFTFIFDYLIPICLGH